MSVELLSWSVQQQHPPPPPPPPPPPASLAGYRTWFLRSCRPSRSQQNLPPVSQSFTDQLCHLLLLLWWRAEPFPPQPLPPQPLACGWDWPAPTGSRPPGCLLARERRGSTSDPLEAPWSSRSQWSRPGPCLCGRGWRGGSCRWPANKQHTFKLFSLLLAV